MKLVCLLFVWLTCGQSGGCFYRVRLARSRGSYPGISIWKQRMDDAIGKEQVIRMRGKYIFIVIWMDASRWLYICGIACSSTWGAYHALLDTGINWSSTFPNCKCPYISIQIANRGRYNRVWNSLPRILIQYLTMTTTRATKTGYVANVPPPL